MKTAFILLLICTISTSYSQPQLKVHVRAPNGLVYFYKKGLKNDSLISKDDAVFYLVCKEKQKKNILLLIENARFSTLDTDSLLLLEYLPGLKYEVWYVQSEDSASVKGQTQSVRSVWNSFLNGTTQLSREQIKIQIYLKKENELILENVYYYRD